MLELISCLGDLNNDSKFFKFQNKVVELLYNELIPGYENGEDEVLLVSRLVNAVNGESYGPMRLLAKKIHGSRSFVNFQYMNKGITKELGDMVVISVATAGRKRLFQRISIIQNKKSKKTSWGIDSEQLFLLKNFPLFTGESGVFKDRDNVAFRNESRCLGSYGLFCDPGEMVFVSAPLVASLLSGKKSLSLSALSLPFEYNSTALNVSRFPWWSGRLRYNPRELRYILRELSESPHFPLMWPFGSESNFLGNTVFGRDLYDFVRAWTQFSLGEVTYAYDTVLNSEVDAFANLIIAAAGFSDLFEMPMPRNDVFPERQLEGDLAVILMHVDVPHEG